MAREQQIIDTARERADRHQIAERELNNYNNQLYFYDRIYNAEIASFEAGVKWADNHPVNVWHDASEEPKIGPNIVAIDSDGNWWDIRPYHGDYDGYGLKKGWRSCIRTYDIQKWAYISDLLPKGCER